MIAAGVNAKALGTYMDRTLDDDVTTATAT